MKNVGQSLGPKGSAVLLLVRSEDYTPEAKAYLESYDAQLFEADFTEEVEAAVLKAGEDKNVATAVEAEYTEES